MKISAKQYANALYELTLNKSESDIDVVIDKFSKELVRNNQLRLISKVIEKFEQIYNEKNGIVNVEITSARDLGEAQLDDVKEFLKEKYKAKNIVLETKINKDIKGGVIIRVGDEVVDASISGKLKKLNFLLRK